MKKYGDEISSGSACFLVRERGLENLDHDFWKWLRDEGFTKWPYHGHYEGVNWVFINVNSLIYAPGMPGIKITATVRDSTGITIDDFKTIWNILKKREEDTAEDEEYPIQKDYKEETNQKRSAGISPTVPKGAHICHIYDIEDAEEAGHDLDTELIKNYGPSTTYRGIELHKNCEDDEGGRSLVRCRKCGALLLSQFSWLGDKEAEPDEYACDWIPVWSEREADLLNIFMEEDDFLVFPFKHLSSYQGKYSWLEEDKPRPMDLPELCVAISMKYRDDLLNATTDEQKEDTPISEEVWQEILKNLPQKETAPDCVQQVGIALKVDWKNRLPDKEELSKYESILRNLRDIPDEFVVFDFMDDEDQIQNGLCFYQVCVDHEDVLRTEVNIRENEAVKMYARESTRDEAINILRCAVKGEDYMKLPGWRDVTEEILGKKK